MPTATAASSQSQLPHPGVTAAATGSASALESTQRVDHQSDRDLDDKSEDDHRSAEQ